jgi:hypothetical protein
MMVPPQQKILALIERPVVAERRMQSSLSGRFWASNAAHLIAGQRVPHMKAWRRSVEP